MNEHTMNIDDLISQYIDGELGSEAEAELHHRLSISPDDRKRFREQIILRGVVRDGRVLESPTPAMRSSLFARLQQEEGMLIAAAAVPAFAAPTSSVDEIGSASARNDSRAPLKASRAADRPPASRRERRRRLVPFLLPFIIGVIATSFLWQSTDNSERRSPAVAAVGEDRSSASSAAKSTDREATSGTTSAESSPSAGTFARPEDARADVDVAHGADAMNDASLASAEGNGRSGALSNSAVDAFSSAALARTDRGAAQSARPRIARQDRTSSTRRDAPSGPSLALADDAQRNGPTHAGFSDGGGVGTSARRHDIAAVEVSPASIAASDPASNDATTVESSVAHETEPQREKNEELSLAIAEPDAREAPRTESTTYRDEIRSSSARSTFAPQPKTVSATDGRDRSAPLTAMPPSVQSAPSVASADIATDNVGGASAPSAEMIIDSSSSEGGASLDVLAARPVLIDKSEFIDRERDMRLSTGVRQSVLIVTDDRSARPELIVRIGGEFSEGTHELFGLLGLTTFGEVSTTTTTEYRQVVDTATQEYLYRSESTAADELRAELWGGAGYRVNVLNNEDWRAGAGVWAGYGERYVRAGIETPVAYRVSKTIRIELTPSVQFLDAHGASVTQIRDMASTDDLGRTQISEQSEVDESEVRAGLSIGVTVVIE